jgi:hypothetical protein
MRQLDHADLHLLAAVPNVSYITVHSGHVSGDRLRNLSCLHDIEVCAEILLAALIMLLSCLKKSYLIGK